MSTDVEIEAAVHAAKMEYLRAQELYAEEVAYEGGDYVSHTGVNYELLVKRRAAHAALRRWMAWAPTAATPWWPGGWRLSVQDRIWPRGGVGDLGVWRTRDDLLRWLDSQRDPGGELPTRLCGTPEWGPVRGHSRTLERTDLHPDVVLDQDFWQQHGPTQGHGTPPPGRAAGWRGGP